MGNVTLALVERLRKEKPKNFVSENIQAILFILNDLKDKYLDCEYYNGKE